MTTSSISPSWGSVFALGLSVTLISAAFLLNRVPNGRGRSYFHSTTTPNRLHQENDPKRETRKRDSRLLVATRIHGASSSSMPSVDNVVNFVKHGHTYASKILICVGVQDPNNDDYIVSISSELKKQDLLSDVTLLPVTPWGQFTFALNCAIAYARDEGFDLIAFQSLEFKVDATVARRLAEYVSNNHEVIVAGPVISGHEFSEGEQIARGRTVPWNTFAVWSIRELALTGFPLVGDGYPARDDAPAIPGGVEEVTTINLLQAIDPTLIAVLVQVENSSFATGSRQVESKMGNVPEIVPAPTATAWETQFDDPKRREYHEKKMRSKDERPAAQMKELGISSGTVVHLSYDHLH